jgi:hypothetical protein
MASLTILTTCWAGETERITSCPTARSRTLDTRSFTTGSATSASSSATRTSRSASDTYLDGLAELLADALQHLDAEVLVGHLAARKAQRHLHLVALADEGLHGAHLHVVVVVVDVRGGP